MADFLASFNFGQAVPTTADDSACHSIDDIQAHLRNTFAAKVTPTRAEHISLSLEMRGSSNITLPETENDSLDGASERMVEGQPDRPMRVVSVNDALSRQTDDPLLQRTIAKHILRAVGEVDNSNWIVRDISRASQGWSFTYICKGSHQFWNRQNTKNPPASLIGEFSLREPDPVLMGRPAFDCRGSVLVAFERSSRSITIRYEHTPIHRTVAQLKELYPAPARELGAGAQRQLQQKTPVKSKKSRNKNNESTEQGEGQSRPKKKRKADTGERGEDGRRPKKPRKRKKNQAENAAPQQLQQELAHDPGQDASQGQASNEPAANVGLPSQPSNPPQPSSHLHPVNVDATEAARRLAHATKLLEDAGIDPHTLSRDQMHIFSNQLPELQRDSLALLSKYGAQHIVIVPPKDKPGAPRSQSSTPVQTQQAPPPAAPATTQAATKDARANATVKDGAQPSSEQALLEAAASALSTVAQSSKKKGKRPPGKSRLACSCCKNRKVKCPKERPICSECQAHSLVCEYPPTKPRKRKTLSEPVVIDDDEGDDEEGEEEEQEEEAPVEDEDQSTYYTGATQQQQSHSHAAHLEEQDTSYSQMPVADMLRPIAQHKASESYPAQSTYYQPATVAVEPQAEPSQARYSTSKAPQPAMAHSSWSTPEIQANHNHVSHASHVSTNSTQGVQIPKPAGSISPSRSRRNAKELTPQGRWKLPDSKPKTATGGWGNPAATHSSTRSATHASAHSGTHSSTHASTHSGTHSGTRSGTLSGTHSGTHSGNLSGTLSGSHSGTLSGTQSATYSHSHTQPGTSATSWMSDQDAQSFNMSTNERTTQGQGTGLYSHQAPVTSSHLQASTFQTSNDNTYWPHSTQASVMHQTQPARQSPSMTAAMHAHNRTSPFQGINSQQRTTSNQNHQTQTWAAANTQGRDASLSGIHRATDTYHQNYYGTMDMNRTNRYT
ncbi:unnamed protein product [Clonostachys rosea]|uniref:Zn(2)-C6 fungal-type domain-containing protein n=1 Tax=Bionectria ochroleuca TaxID=29856 RepID=A0ABY6V5S0_BIOOC|nr:unnamed protein product [Clonostachys rosea]